MKVYTIEIAAAIEEEFKKFLDEWGGGYPMKFTRFIDLGGKQTDLHVYTAVKDSLPWMVIRIKSVFKSEQGECIQYFVSINGGEKHMDEVLVSPEIWKLPALADRVLNFSRNDLLTKISEGGDTLGAGDAAGSSLHSGSSSDDDEDYEDMNTSGILAGDGEPSGMDFNPEDVIASANSGDEEVDPSELIKKMNEADDASGDEGGFNPEDVIKD